MMHALIRAFLFLALAGCLSSAVYYFICLWTAAAFLQRRSSQTPQTNSFPPVSILKPLKGTDPEIYESFRSHCLQDYSEYEIIFGISDPADPAVATVAWLQRDFPDSNIRLVVCPEILGPNVKVSNLEQMVQSARYDYLIVNDSDIRVESDYLQRVISPLADPHVGMVTCLYRGIAEMTFGSKVEALGIADFCASVLVAEQVERGLHFGLGSTLAFRRSELKRIRGGEVTLG